ncbi:MAG: MBOAT family protein [Micavibrio sp.]|nr:MBOAT family protein [Micavibrio sp.]
MGVDSVVAGSSVTFADAWASALAFSFQIYFDFSGYTDMAVGVAFMLGIVLPFNFNSPYKSRNVGEFWRRWHMTLSRWLRDYLYIPLGGNEKGPARAAVNAVIVFLLGGLWHGAAWTFVLWGALQGAGIVVSRYVQLLKIPIPLFVGVVLTFLFATLSWVLFRAASFDVAADLYAIMLGKSGFDMSVRDVVVNNALILFIATTITFTLPNTHVLVPKLAELTKKIPALPIVVMIIIAWLSLAAFDLDSSAEFIYFDF